MPIKYVLPQLSAETVAEGSATVPTRSPATYSPYSTTPVLSVEGVQRSTTEVSLAATRWIPLGALGAWTSGHAAVAVVVEVRGEWLPAASNASTPTVYPLPHARLPNAYHVLGVEPNVLPSRKTP
jgi:hypothetical protein